MPPLPSLRLPALCAALLCAAPAVRAGESISGVCPDGSIFVVRRPADIPCRDARQVDPEAIPPLKPQFLPRPYAWEVFQQQQDPNNPYNLVEAARQVRESGRVEDPAVGSEPPAVPDAPAQTAAAPPGLGLSDQEIRDLFLIVELHQERVPATFDPEDGLPVALSLAHSAAFDARLREARAREGRPLQGPALLFAAVARAPSAFHPHLTFVQGHQAFQPDLANPEQLGTIHGAFGGLEASQAVLGYVVLPEHLDAASPMDIYWNDRRLRATLRPGSGP